MITSQMNIRVLGIIYVKTLVNMCWYKGPLLVYFRPHLEFGYIVSMIVKGSVMKQWAAARFEFIPVANETH